MHFHMGLLPHLVSDDKPTVDGKIKSVRVALAIAEASNIEWCKGQLEADWALIEVILKNR